MIYNPYSLEGKTIFVTGASSGIGKAIAIECSKLGATVILTARNEERLKETLDQLEGNGHQTIVADITKEDDRKRLADSIPQIDGFVCNAGITKRKPVSFVKEEELREIFETNTFAAFLLTKAIMKAKKINKEGSMVFMASMAAKTVTPGNSMYAASKAAIESFSRSCALEYAAKGIRANAILPGMIETPLINSGMLSEVEIERDKQHYMLKRYGKPEEIAWAVIFLLSDASKWITSTSLLINGGGRIVKEKD
jgi:NAD(P)-dependent dehydrogenase (short-subunit alcohol dehydrogenase family)